MSFRAKFDLGKTNPVNLVIGILIMVAIFYGLFKLTQWLFTLLYYVAPLLLIATLIIDINVVKEYIQTLGKLVKRNTPLGIAAIALSVVFAPVPIAYMFIKAIMKRKVDKYIENQRRIEEGDLVDFEELESRPLERKETRRLNDDDTV